MRSQGCGMDKGISRILQERRDKARPYHQASLYSGVPGKDRTLRLFKA